MDEILVEFEPVPEPQVGILLYIGLLLVVLARRTGRKRREYSQIDLLKTVPDNWFGVRAPPVVSGVFRSFSAPSS
jgi:hypothetical protein